MLYFEYGVVKSRPYLSLRVLFCDRLPGTCESAFISGRRTV